MLDGTDLSSAFQPLGSSGGDPYASLYSSAVAEEQPQQQQEPVVKKEKMAIPQPSVMYDASTLNKQYEQEQKLATILNEIKKKKEQPVTPDNNSYFDKLFSKKKELFKILQLALIVTLGLSVHYLIDHYLKNYLQENDLTFERQLVLRMLYPLGVLFFLWNIKVFVK